MPDFKLKYTLTFEMDGDAKDYPSASRDDIKEIEETAMKEREVIAAMFENATPEQLRNLKCSVQVIGLP